MVKRTAGILTVVVNVLYMYTVIAKTWIAGWSSWAMCRSELLKAKLTLLLLLACLLILMRKNDMENVTEVHASIV